MKTKLVSAVFVLLVGCGGGGSAEEEEIPPTPFGSTPSQIIDQYNDTVCALPQLCPKSSSGY